MKSMLNSQLLVVELPLVPHHLTQDSASDGLHLGPTQKFELFGKVIQDAIDTHHNGKKKQEVGLVLNPDLREAYKLMRRHKRKERKNRLANTDGSYKGTDFEMDEETVEALKLVKRQKRRMQRTRAAERAIYAAAKMDSASPCEQSVAVLQQ